MYAVALFRFHIFDPIPAARETVIEQIREGMLVLDIQQKIVDLNPAAEKILGMPAARIRGHAAGEVLPASLLESAQLDSQGTAQAEICLGNGRGARDYTLQLSPLKDWHGSTIGLLMLLHDVTEQNRAQAQLMEQQRVVATLEEGERLARELHDQLAQEISFINLQAQAACALLDSGQDTQAKAAILRLAEIARLTQTDMRELISFLINPATLKGGFLETLRWTTDGFCHRSGIQVELQVPDSFHRVPLSSTAEVQLLRIIQEALTNIRKHANAGHVLVSLAVDLGQIELAIEDDGVGFDPDKLAGNDGNFGLGIMADRAEEIGAAFQVVSQPGSGARVTVSVPVDHQALG
jgi:PAS domain S-box-containing protein